MSSVKKCEKTFCKKYTDVYTQAIIKAVVKRTKKKLFLFQKKKKL
jgi:hypothetical protein